MEMAGNCHICGRQATNSCSICGLLTCHQHLKNGVCSECRRGTISEESKEEKRYYKDEEVYR